MIRTIRDLWFTDGATLPSDQRLQDGPPVRDLDPQAVQLWRGRARVDWACVWWADRYRFLHIGDDCEREDFTPDGATDA